MMKISDLTVLSFGGGQDSTAILLMLLLNQTLRKKYAPGELIVVMSDTGNEHQYTYDHVKNVEKLCIQYGIPFFFLTSDMGYHAASWPNLIDPQLREVGGKYKPTMIQLGTKSCTDKLKINPIYKFVDEYINKKMNYGFNVRKTRGCGKQAFKKFVKENGKIRVLIGFAKGEEKRVEKSLKIQERDYNSKEDNFEKGIFREFPLVEEGMSRESCQKYIEEKIGYCPAPSNCVLCPYMSDVELIWLFKNDLKSFELWERIESNKISRDQGKEKNFGPFCSKKTLREKLESALEKYKNWTDEQIAEYKFSHGCQSNAM